MAINWSDPKCKISRHFTVKEAIWLPQWNRLAQASDGLNDHVKSCLYDFFVNKMDKVRDFLQTPIRVHVCYRPKAYNVLVSGSPNSSHMCSGGFWAAIDWSVPNVDCETIRKKILPNLEMWGLRMENNGPDGNWIHLDNRPVPPGGLRYFIP